MDKIDAIPLPDEEPKETAEEFQRRLFASMIQDVTISTALSKEDLLDLGKRKPYYRYASFPASGTLLPEEKALLQDVATKDPVAYEKARKEFIDVHADIIRKEMKD